MQPFKARRFQLGFRQITENLWSCENAWHAFIQGWRDPCMLQAMCQPVGKSWLPCILNTHKTGMVPRYCIAKCDSAHVGPFSRLWECYLLDPFSRLWEYCLLGPVREPGWLHFSYNLPCQVSSPYNLCKGVFREGPWVRRAELCTQMLQQQCKLQQHTTKTQVQIPKTLRTHRLLGVRDAHHSHRGSPVRCSQGSSNFLPSAQIPYKPVHPWTVAIAKSWSILWLLFLCCITCFA